MSAVTLSGVVLDGGTGQTVGFAASWSMSGGWGESAGCDTWLMGQSASGYSMTLGGAPSSFGVNEAWAPYPCGGPVYVGLVGGPLDLWWVEGSPAIHGTVAGWTIEAATMVVGVDPPPTGTPEPGVLMLAAVAAVVYNAMPWLRYRPRRG